MTELSIRKEIDHRIITNMQEVYLDAMSAIYFPLDRLIRSTLIVMYEVRISLCITPLFRMQK